MLLRRDTPRAVRLRGGCSHRRVAVRPARAARGAGRGRHRRADAAARSCDGLALSFTFATVALVYLLSALGLPDDLFRTLAIVVLGVAGVTLLVPAAAARVEAWLQRLAPRAPAQVGGDGFGSGLVLGASLGFVYAPCAGPILAGVITVSASQDFTAGRLAVALAYSAGSAAVLYVLMIGGRRLTSPLARRSGTFQRAMGGVMVAVALLMAAELDISFENRIAADLPAVLVNPSKSLEESGAASDRLADLRGGGGGRRAGRHLASGEGPCRPRHRAGDTGHAALVQHRGRAAAHAPLAARPGRADRLLDLLLHQLHPDPARAPGLGRPLSPRRADDHRPARAGVPVRARRRQRRAGDRAQPAALPGRAGQRLRRTGARTGTSTGPPSTSSTRAGACATCTSARATTT